MDEPTTSLRLYKISLSGGLIYHKDFPTLEDISKHLKISLKNALLIQQGHRFPKGKLGVLNKYQIRPTPVKNPLIVSFD